MLEAKRQMIIPETLAVDFTAYELADALLAPKGEGDFTASFAIGDGNVTIHVIVIE